MIGGIGGKGGDGGAARQGNTGGGQRADGEHDLVLRGERIGAGGHFVVHDLVGQAHAADVLLVGVGRLRRDRARAQIDAEDLTGPSVRCFVSHVASPNLFSIHALRDMSGDSGADDNSSLGSVAHLMNRLSPL